MQLARKPAHPPPLVQPSSGSLSSPVTVTVLVRRVVPLGTERQEDIEMVRFVIVIAGAATVAVAVTVVGNGRRSTPKQGHLATTPT